jgi:hypothetical protein
MAINYKKRTVSSSGLNFKIQVWADADKMRITVNLGPRSKADFILANWPFNMSDGAVKMCGRTCVGATAGRLRFPYERR